MRRGKICAALMLATCFLLVLTCAFALWDQVVWPEPSGDVVLENQVLLVDASHVSDGYYMVRIEESSTTRYKLQVKCNGKKFPEYDLKADGEWTVFPFQLGNGQYTITLYKLVSNKGYAVAGKVTVDVKLSGEYAPFLAPNQFVNYREDTEAVAIGDALCAGLTTDAEKFEAIRLYIHDNYQYDYERARNAKSGLLPDIDYCTTNKMGICQDLSAMAACMLRTQGIPARFCIGYMGNQYHAWLMVLLDGKEVRYDPSNDINDVVVNNYTLERYY